MSCVLAADQKPQGNSNKYEDSAWSILVAGMQDKSAERRAQAISSLDLLAGEPRAIAAAESALKDTSSGVRVAAINALGDMNARASLPKIKALIADADGKMLVAIAAVLKKFEDPEGNEIYYEILTGTRKAGGGILSGIKDRKNLERMGIEEAIGFVPFGGIGLGAYYYFRQNASANSGLLALAALALATDPDPATEKALIQASYDDADPVKVAALRALAKRGNPAVIEQIGPAMQSDKPIVSYTAAAAVLRLSHAQKHAHRGGVR
ncbi:MAG TPA: HEAT repeat domain-containing protein [Bryobacteraceae bacterium]|nr:HEAT repeat domain-containing protein [Bryobacteraceae bacterium]